MHLDRNGLEQLADRLGTFFYLLMAVAFLAAVAGSSGDGLFFLLVGAAAHVVRAALEGLLARGDDDLRLDLRLPSLSGLELPPPPRRTSARQRR